MSTPGHPVIKNIYGDQYAGTRFTPIYKRYGEGGRKRRDELSPFQINNLQLGEIVRLMVLQIEVIVMFILELLAAVASLIWSLVLLLSPYFFGFLLFIIVYWMAYIGFPYTMKLVVFFGIPFVNML